MKALEILILVAVGLVGTGIIQSALRPFEVLVAGWIGLAATVLFWSCLVLVYVLFGRTRSNNRHSPELERKQLKRIFDLLAEFSIIGACVVMPLIVRAWALSEVTVQKRAIQRSQWIAAEERLGFRLAFEDAGESQHIRFIRGEGRETKVRNEFSQEPQKTPSEPKDK